jgi:hypothetical protein
MTAISLESRERHDAIRELVNFFCFVDEPLVDSAVLVGVGTRAYPGELRHEIQEFL